MGGVSGVDDSGACFLCGFYGENGGAPHGADGDVYDTSCIFVGLVGERGFGVESVDAKRMVVGFGFSGFGLYVDVFDEEIVEVVSGGIEGVRAFGIREGEAEFGVRGSAHDGSGIGVDAAWDVDGEDALVVKGVNELDEFFIERS